MTDQADLKAEESINFGPKIELGSGKTRHSSSFQGWEKETRLRKVSRNKKAEKEQC